MNWTPATNLTLYSSDPGAPDYDHRCYMSVKNKATAVKLLLKDVQVRRNDIQATLGL